MKPGGEDTEVGKRPNLQALDVGVEEREVNTEVSKVAK